MAKAESEYKLMNQRISRTGSPDYSIGHQICYNGSIGLIVPTQNKQKKPPVDIIDVGSGCGFGYQWMCEKLRIKSYLGIDIDHDSAYHHRSLLKNESHKVINDSFLSIHIENDSYDYAFCIEVIEHLELYELERWFKQIRSVLRERGTLFLSTPEGNKKDYDYNPHGEYSEVLIREILNETGFENVVCLREHWTKLYICQ